MGVAAMPTPDLVKLKLIAGPGIGSIHAIPVASGEEQGPTEDGRGL